jgi:hypothetical protein
MQRRPDAAAGKNYYDRRCGHGLRHHFGHYMGGDHKWYIPGISFHILETMSIFTIPIALMAVMTNATAIKRILGAKKTLDGRDAATASNAGNKLIAVNRYHSYCRNCFCRKRIGAETNRLQLYRIKSLHLLIRRIHFPVPVGNPNQLFYLQRTTNTNTIVCELNLNKQGTAGYRITGKCFLDPFPGRRYA